MEGVIGSVVGVDQGGHVTEVAITVHGMPLIVDVTRNGFMMTNLLDFVTTDCTGQPFLDASSTPFLITAVSGSNKLFAENGPARAITVLSSLDPVTGCFQTNQAFSDAVPVAAVMDLNAFKPPFRVRTD